MNLSFPNCKIKVIGLMISKTCFHFPLKKLSNVHSQGEYYDFKNFTNGLAIILPEFQAGLFS